MKAILGLLKADSGEIVVGGERVVYGQTSTNQYIGYLPGVPKFYPFMTAAEYLRFCDEPTSALDPVGRKEILGILLKKYRHSMKNMLT